MASIKGFAARLFGRHDLAKEFDPESEIPSDDNASQDGDLGGGNDESEKEDTKDTEHYVAVGKSQLRQKQHIPLGEAYRGVRVSREQLEQSSEDEDGEGDEDDEDEDEDEDAEENEDNGDEPFDDPDNVDLEKAEDIDSEDEIDSDNAFGSDDEDFIKKFAFRGSSKPKPATNQNGKRDEGEDRDEDENDEEEEEEEAEEEEEDDDDDEDESDAAEEADPGIAKTQAETRRILAQERKQVLASISQAAKADADKGFAVRQQRRTFDVLLNMRIRMQKALVASNSFHEATEDENGADSVDSDAIEAAAQQVVELLNSIQSIRQSFYAGDSNAAKRKRTAGDEANAADNTRSCEAIFDQLAQTEEAASAKRRKVLDRWAARVRRPTASGAPFSAGGAASRRFSAPAEAQALSAVLDGQLVTPDRLVQRTRTPRSCAPVQAAKRVEADPEIYDDADFYQLLLKELVDQRTSDASAPGSTAPTVRWAAAAAKEAKTRKHVDRKASKGRKMRFNVHEKLQNFMAPEDRRGWEPEAIDRFFSTLFGQRMELGEDDAAADGNDDDDDDEQNGGVSLEEEGLRLFRG
ncbi:vesicle-mediated transport protein [Niveomyces insectorum RCEF 264]|uniref:Protein BFR2 n=1 Tax=Niveomyces insectorum RCEF 264 TaxID=1081102 RepID=A0A167ZY38_9HYPO|nr:vesicle-mediated transport protein [Niveomyces insectorum RCEF 264]